MTITDTGTVATRVVAEPFVTEAFVARSPEATATGAGGVDGIVADPWFARTVTVPASRCGPPGMANGGWVCGTVAGHLGPGPVEVTLRAPTPLEAPLDLRAADDRATLSAGGRLLATAVRSSVPVRPVDPVAWDDAIAAEPAFVGHHDHPFPGCFVCGTERPVGDGLRVFPAPIAGAPGRCAAVVTPHPALAGPDGRLSPATVWAALDCPTAWVNMTPGGVALLGRLHAEVRVLPRAGEPCLVVAESAGRDGRKAFGRASLYDRSGRLLAASRAVWIVPRSSTG
jgi:hypothetical protein